MTDKILTETYARLIALEEGTSPEEAQINVLTLRMRRAVEDDDEVAYKRAVDQLNALTDKMNAEQPIEEDSDYDELSLHDAAIDMLDDMYFELPKYEQNGEKGAILRYAIKRLQEVGLGK